jgi:hypothetical protein
MDCTPLERLPTTVDDLLAVTSLKIPQDAVYF